ncbi:MAG: PEP-CTERM sorting domain-containing protein [Planctomycetota bacterium]
MEYTRNALTALALTAGLAAIPASATLVAYDGFDGYSIGSLDGQATPKTGFSSFGWFVNGGGGEDPEAVATGLAFPGLLTSDGGAFIPGDRGGRKLTTTYDNSSTGTVWISWLYQQANTTDTTYRALELHNGLTEGGPLFDSNRVFHVGHSGGDFGSDTEFGFRVNNDNGLQASTGVSVNTDVNLFIVKIELSDVSNSDSVTVWVNPTDFSSEGALGSGTSVSGFDLQFDQVTLADFGGSELSIDEIRIATTLASAVPVPEPASLALLALGSMFVMRRRRD